MGRHAAPPPPRRSSVRASSVPGRRTPTAAAGFLVAGAGAVFLAAAVMGVSAAGVSLAPREPAAPKAAPTPSPSVSTVVLTSSPAQSVVATTLGTTPAAGWAPASALAWTGGTPFDQACGRPTTDAALAGSRIYAVAGRQVVATVSAYSAGAGAVAFSQWSSLLSSCSTPLARYAATTVSADAMVVGIAAQGGRPAASALLWRRGDVIGVVATPAVKPDGLAAAAVDLDRALLTAMGGSCASINSTLADAARSPWVSSDSFTGLTVPVTVTVAPTPVPPAPPGVTPVPAGWSPSPLPSISFPVRPLDPVWPPDLPTPVGSPVLPVAPTPAPTVSLVPSRTPDPVGPGCGWAFTGQVEPPFNAQQEAAIADGLKAQAEADLAGSQALYASDVLSYWQEIPLYEQQAAAFVAYANAVSAVASAWDGITAQRAEYARLVAEYDAAVTAHNDFLNRQAAAQAAYDAALAACAAVPTPTPTPTSTDTPTPTATGTETPTATPTTTPAPGCPPVMPPILTQTAPTVPPVPTPPPDPRPSGSPTR